MSLLEIFHRQKKVSHELFAILSSPCTISHGHYFVISDKLVIKEFAIKKDISFGNRSGWSLSTSVFKLLVPKESNL